ncbi:MAG TPA: YdcF family protein [Terriglobia bacterium]|nr:YdcF family protein [Terriglobia bacterium]
MDEHWLSPEGAQRTWAALQLYKMGFAPAIISSGSSRGGFDQATLQAKLLITAGVPSSAIFVENHSSRTYQSALEITRILNANGWHSVVIVTSELDVPRVRGVFRKLGYTNLSFQQVPEVAPPGRRLFYHSGWRAFYHATYEYAGLLLYKWKGWIA